jgi:hypothetical protein
MFKGKKGRSVERGSHGGMRQRRGGEFVKITPGPILKCDEATPLKPKELVNE